MREHDQACLPAGRTLGSGAGCPPRQPVPPGAGGGRQRVGLGGLWLLLVPVACCGGPLLVAGLAAAGALAWGGLGLALAALLMGALTVNRLHRRRHCESSKRQIGRLSYHQDAGRRVHRLPRQRRQHNGPQVHTGRRNRAPIADMRLSRLTPPLADRQRLAVTAFAVPKYLAETARLDEGVHDWIAGLPGIVAGLAGRWSLRVGEPFQPGGQCSWTAPVTDPAGADLVLKVGFRFPGGDERDEAAGLRSWDGNGAVRLYAAHESESAYALLLEQCMPGTPLGQALPEPEQDLVVAGLLRQLWAQRRAAYPFRPLAQMCAAWAEEFEQEYAATTSSPPSGPHGWSSTPSPTSATPPTTSCSTS